MTVTHEIVNGGFPAEIALSVQDLKHMVAYTTMSIFSTDNAVYIGFKSDNDGDKPKTASMKPAQD